MATKEEDSLYAKGLRFNGLLKSYCGKVDYEGYSRSRASFVDTFGYYQKSENCWIVYMTDSERGAEIIARKCDSEPAAKEMAVRLAEQYNLIDLCHKTLDHFDRRRPALETYLQKEYKYNDENAKQAIDYLLQAKYIAFEFSYFVDNGKFIREEFAENYSGYTAEKLFRETKLTPLGAFNYMVYLKNKPEEALAHLKEHLPVRGILSEEEVKKLDIVPAATDNTDPIDKMAMDVIHLTDSTTGYMRIYSKREPTVENYKELWAVVKGIVGDLQNILHKQNIEHYQVEGHVVDPSRQVNLRWIPTDEKEKDGLVAFRTSDGYEKNGKVFRPEKIKAFKYVPPEAKKSETENTK